MADQLSQISFNINLKDKLTFVRSLLDQGNYEALARECCFILEDLMRKIYLGLFSELTATERERLVQIESDFNSSGVKNFGLGQLIGLYSKANMIDLIEEHFGIQLTMVKAVDLNAINQIRLQLTHKTLEDNKISSGEAQLIYNYLITWLAYLGYSALEEADQTNAGAGKTDANSRSTKKHRRQRSSYSATYGRERERLNVQAENLRAFDQQLISKAFSRCTKKKGLLVADIGCSNGFITVDRFDLKEIEHVFGFDSNRTQIDEANKRYSENAKFTFHEADVDSREFLTKAKKILLESEQESFDIVFSALTLHHLANPRRHLRLIRRLLTPDSTIILRGADDGSKLGYPDNGLVRRVVERTISQEGMSDRLHGRKLYSYLSECGFTGIEMEYNVKDISKLSIAERLNVFDESFSYRIDNLKQGLEKKPNSHALQEEYEEMVLMLDELEGLFTTPNFNYIEVDFAAIATVMQ